MVCLVLRDARAASDGASFYCKITDLYGTSTTSSAVVRITPGITTQPASTASGAGQMANFTIVATGPGLSYNWQRNGVSAGAPSAATYSYVPLPSEIGTIIAVTCIVTNANGNLLSAVANLTVMPPPVITVQPVNTYAKVGGAVSLVAAGTGSGTLSYKWYNASAAQVATTATYTFTAALGAWAADV